MKKVLFALLALIFLFTEVSALCSNGQVDINSASLEDLDKLTGIGPVKAQAIIDTRPFSSIDDLMNVSGIGPATLDKIKVQGLACVEGADEESTQNEGTQETQKEETNVKKDTESKNKIKSEITEYTPETPSNISANITGEDIKTIILTPKDIKSESDKEQLNKNKLPIYGLIVFCILLVFLFIFKNRKKENEFK
jgi:competence ComEA-like helix-hairpin-helix protein